MGTVTAISDHSLSVKTKDGASTTVEFDGETKFVKGDTPATAKDVVVGSRVVIHADKRDNSLHAGEIRIGVNAARTSNSRSGLGERMKYRKAILLGLVLSSLTAFATIFGTVSG